MTRLALLLVLGCAGPSNYRDVDGRPVSTTARLDADGDPVRVRCGGEVYHIVTPPVPYATGTHLATKTPFVRDHALMCARIRAADR